MGAGWQKGARFLGVGGGVTKINPGYTGAENESGRGRRGFLRFSTGATAC